MAVYSCLIGHSPANLFSRSKSLAVAPVTTKSSPCVISEIVLYVWKNRVFERCEVADPLLELTLQVAFQIASGVSCAVHALSQQSNLSCNVLSLLLHRQTHQHWPLSFGVKCARATSKCILPNGSQWFAAIESVAFSPFHGKVPACNYGLPTLFRCFLSLESFVCFNLLGANWADSVLRNCSLFTTFVAHTNRGP